MSCILSNDQPTSRTSQAWHLTFVDQTLNLVILVVLHHIDCKTAISTKAGYTTHAARDLTVDLWV